MLWPLCIMIIWPVIKYVFIITPINPSWMFGAILHQHLFCLVSCSIEATRRYGPSGPLDPNPLPQVTVDIDPSFIAILIILTNCAATHWLLGLATAPLLMVDCTQCTTPLLTVGCTAPLLHAVFDWSSFSAQLSIGFIGLRISAFTLQSETTCATHSQSNREGF